MEQIIQQWFKKIRSRKNEKKEIKRKILLVETEVNACQIELQKINSFKNRAYRATYIKMFEKYEQLNILLNQKKTKNWLYIYLGL